MTGRERERERENMRCGTRDDLENWERCLRDREWSKVDSAACPVGLRLCSEASHRRRSDGDEERRQRHWG